jgi:hypothetical protein
MKLHRAAALMATVWYLLGPPQKGGPADFDTQAAFSKWKIIDRFSDISTCEQQRLAQQGEWYARQDADLAGSKAAINDAVMLIYLAEAKCIASDDPRLKPN